MSTRSTTSFNPAKLSHQLITSNYLAAKEPTSQSLWRQPALASAQHANFRRMSSKGTAAGVKADTGYTVDLMGYLWRKYRTRLINRVRHYEGFRVVRNKGEQTLAEHVALCMYAAFWYVHIYPTTDAIGGWELRYPGMGNHAHYP